MHLLVAALPILLGTARFYAKKSSYPVASFPSFCVAGPHTRSDWKKGKPLDPLRVTLLRETRLLGRDNASSPALRFLARGHFFQESDSGSRLRDAGSLSCDKGLKGRIDLLLNDLYSKPRRWASSDGSWAGDPGTITHVQFVVSHVKLNSSDLRASLDAAGHVRQIVQVSVPHGIAASNETKARGAASVITPKRGPPLHSVADAPEWARKCPPPEWATKWLLCELDASGRMRKVAQMWPPPQWHPCSKAPCDLACPLPAAGQKVLAGTSKHE